MNGSREEAKQIATTSKTKRTKKNCKKKKFYEKKKYIHTAEKERERDGTKKIGEVEE